jgi:hypothetical protein
MNDERETEKLLERFSPNPAPPWLRTRVLGAARRESEARRILTPAWGWIMATSLVLTVAFFIADWRLSSGEFKRLSSLLDGRGLGTPTAGRAEEKAAEEFLAYLPELDPVSRLTLKQSLIKGQAARLSRKSAPRRTEEIHEF